MKSLVVETVMVLMAAVIAAAMKVVGALPIPALLIIPPAAARGLARTPQHLAVLPSRPRGAAGAYPRRGRLRACRLGLRDGHRRR